MVPQVATRIWRLVICLLFGLALASTANAASPEFAQALADDPTMEYSPDSVLIKFKPMAGPAQKSQAYDAVGGRKIRGYGLVRGLEHVQLGRGRRVEQAIESLRQLPFVEYVEPDYVLRANTDDYFYDLQWGLENTGQDILGTEGTPNADIDVELAWGIVLAEPENPDIIIAVIDTGTDYNHPDLDDNMWTNLLELDGLPGVDDDENGFIDDVHGYDFWGNDGSPMDGHGHGSHVAGTICAETGNLIGVAGVAQRCQIMALRFLGPNGGSTGDAIAALDYALSWGVKVSNNSWGGGLYSQSLYEALQNADNQGHLFIAAAGNDSLDTDIFTHYPSSYDLDNVISVAATDNLDELSSFSNYGEFSVDVGAPGTDIASTAKNGEYWWMSGTSMAAPHVTGLVALIWDQHPNWTHTEVRNHIFSTVRPLPALDGITVTGGIINAFNALDDSTTAPIASIYAPASGAIVSGSVTIKVAASDAEDLVGSLTVDVSIDGGASWQAADYNAVSEYYEFDWNTLGVGDGMRTIDARATDSDTKMTDATQIGVTVDNVNDAPMASFTYSCDGTDCSFDGTGSSDADGTVDGYSWDFGDESSGTGALANHYFAVTGTYEVTLTVTDNDGETGTDTQTVIVTEPLVLHVASLGGEAVAARGRWNAVATIAVQYGDGQPVSNATVSGTWSIGATGSDTCNTDGSGECSITKQKLKGNVASVTFRVDGVTDSSGTGTYVNLVENSIVISQSGESGGNQSPSASFSHDCPSLTCSFDASGSGDPNGTIVSYDWNFGDGATDIGLTSGHTYSADGPYIVTLTVTDDEGATDTVSQSVPVGTVPPGGFTLSASGHKVKGVQHADLSWEYATSSNVDVVRDGNIVVTTPNDGAHDDIINLKGGGSYVYQVCETGTSTCSNTVTVTF